MDAADPRRLADLVERLARVLAAKAHAAGLPPVPWEALRHLARANRPSATPSALAAWLGATRGTVSQTLLALKGKGLVRRRRDRTDGRSVSLALTPEGMARLAADPLARLESAAAALPAGDRATAVRSLEAMTAAGLAARDGRVFGICRTCRFFEAAAEGPETRRCGLLGIALGAEEADRLCAEHAPPPASARS